MVIRRPGAIAVSATEIYATDFWRDAVRRINAKTLRLAGRLRLTLPFAIVTTTRRDNLVTFPGFASLEDVPLRGVSVGLGTIGEARSLRLVLHGAGKREAAARLLALDRFEPSWPASIVHDHPDAEIWIDEEALP